MDLHPYLFYLSFYLLYFVLPSFKDNGLPFWVPDVLCQHSEVVLWNLFGVQMFFRWIFWGRKLSPCPIPPPSYNCLLFPYFNYKILSGDSRCWVFPDAQQGVEYLEPWSWNWEFFVISAGSVHVKWVNVGNLHNLTERLSYTVQFSRSLMSDSLQPHGPQHTRPPCPSPTPGFYPNSCPLGWWYHPTQVILCHPLLPPSVFPSIRAFSNESVLHIKWPK